MTTINDGALRAPEALAAERGRYFTAWRWHFYAGLYVIPFLAMLAVTGLTMLWISWWAGLGAEHATVSPGPRALPVSALQRAAEAAVPGGHAVQYISPLAPDRVATMAVATEAGTTGVALDPYDGAVVKTFPWRAGWYDFANDVHGTLMIGRIGDMLIEVAASLSLILVVSGLYLHWPRKSGWRGALLPRLSALRGRAWWKALHGATGIWISGLLVLFLLSGLSWSGVWGERIVQAWNTFPAEKYAAPASAAPGRADAVVPLSDDPHAAMNHGGSHEVPWALEQTPMPASGSLAGTAAVTGPVDIDGVAAFAHSLGFEGRFQIKLPKDETGVWTISHDSMSNDGHDPQGDRTVHIDRYTGNVLADIRYADYSAYARAMAWGIAFHEGDLGVWNLVLNTAFCLSVLGIALSGAVMWWKRRPAAAGHLAAPPRSPERQPWLAGAILVTALGLAFPLGGLSILLIIMADATLLRAMPSLRRRLA